MLNHALGSCGDIIKAIVGVIAGVATFLWGKPDFWFYTLIALTVLDYVSGIIAAIIEKKVSSHIGWIGILKKVLLLFIVALAHILDNAMNMAGAIRSMVIGFFAANEGISLLENCARAGVSFPSKLLDLLKQFNDKNNS